MSNDLTVKKTSRRGFRAYVTKKVGEIDQLISDYNDRQATGGAGPAAAPPAAADDFADTSERIIAELQQIEQRWESEDKVNGEISCLITDDDQLERELADQEAYKDERLIIRMKVHKFVNRNVQTSTTFQVQHPSPLFVPQRNVAAASVSYREPTLQKFDGDVYKWQSWWELYDANVHSINMPTRIKFAELEKALEGSAARVIEGISRTEHHYNTAIQLLQEAYGDNKFRIEKLMDDLMDLPPVRDQYNVKSLRSLLDGIVINVRMLSNLGRDQSSYSGDLLRRLVAKMPREFAIHWNETAAETAKITELIEFLTKKVKSRERCEITHKSVPRSEPKPEPRPAKAPSSTVATLATTVSSKTQQSCHYCKKDHRSVHCPLSVNEKYEIANRERRCHNCLAVGHRVSKCYPQNPSCHKCGARHHTSLCRRGAKPEPGGSKPAAAAESGNAEEKTVRINVVNCISYSHPPANVFLQTMTFRFKSVQGRWFVGLLDLGAQRTLVRKKVAEECGLTAIDEEVVSYVGVGGVEAYAARKRYRLQLCPGFPSDETIEVEALEKDHIVTATAAYPIPFTSQMLQRGLKLADHRFISPVSGELSVDVLIGADWYWKVVSEEKLMCGDLVAVASRFGWTLSGPMYQGFCGDPTKITSMMVRANQVDVSEDSSVADGDLKTAIADLSAFFELEHIGIRDKDIGSSDTPMFTRIDPCIVHQVAGI